MLLDLGSDLNRRAATEFRPMRAGRSGLLRATTWPEDQKAKTTRQKVHDLARYFNRPPANPYQARTNLPSQWVLKSRVGRDAEQTLSAALRKTIRLVRPDDSDKGFEGFVPTVEGVSDHDFVFDKISPPGTFFDIGLIHILTTSTIDALLKTAPGSRNR